MILESGSHILVVHRRLFEQDKPRFFIGLVEAYENAVARVTGFTWIQDSFHGKIIKKDGIRTKLLSVSSGTLILYVLPNKISLPSTRIEYGKDNQIFLTDGANFRLDLSEGFHRELAKK